MVAPKLVAMTNPDSHISPGTCKPVARLDQSTRFGKSDAQGESSHNEPSHFELSYGEFCKRLAKPVGDAYLRHDESDFQGVAIHGAAGKMV